MIMDITITVKLESSLSEDILRVNVRIRKHKVLNNFAYALLKRYELISNYYMQTVYFEIGVRGILIKIGKLNLVTITSCI